jgi:RNA polymerase sigma factor (sigma-70 family)
LGEDDMIKEEEIKDLVSFCCEYYKKNEKFAPETAKLLEIVSPIIQAASAKFRKSKDDKYFYDSFNYEIFLKCLKNYNSDKNCFIPYLYRKVINSYRYANMSNNQKHFFTFSTRFKRFHGLKFNKFMNEKKFEGLATEQIIDIYSQQNNIKKDSINLYLQYENSKFAEYDKKNQGIANDSYNQEEFTTNKAIVGRILNVIQTFPQREQDIMTTVYSHKYTDNDIIAKYGISKQRVSQIREELITKLKKSVRL